ncbi:MAG: hypothetical protein ABSB14_19725 [Candidatus Sulfotelmatobacter sp.]
MKSTPVILSGVEASRSEVSTQSKDPYRAGTNLRPRKEFSLYSRLAFPPAYGKALAAILLLTSLAAAQTLTGTVKNSTTGKPSAGDDVVLLKLGEGMDEAGRTQTDAKGKFSFKLDDDKSPHLVRTIHQGVTYHRMAPPGTTSVELEVFDAAKKIPGIDLVADIVRLQAEQGRLEIVREFFVQNKSKPPRTQMNDRNLEFYIPEGATIIPDSASATTEGGNPLKSAPVPQSEKNRYSFIFPLRPGQTRFEVAYELPYTGSANLDPKSLYPTEHFVVMMPKAMQFTAANDSAGFKSTPYPQEPDAVVQVASNTAQGENLAFKISGVGMLQGSQEADSAKGEAGDKTSRPGGGLGPPIDAPDPLQKYRWYILGGIAAALIVGGIFVAVRQQSANRKMARLKAASPMGTPVHFDDDEYGPAPTLGTPNVRPAAAARPASMLLDALKEELFQLEVERRQGQISQSEYESAKSALDQTLDRALKREAQKA